MSTRNYHITQRGSRLYYVCRIPTDLQHYFPVRKICRSLKTAIKKYAKVLAATIEHETQGLFMALRSNVFDENTKAKMLTTYMQRELTVKEAEIHGKVLGDDINAKKANAFATYIKHLETVPDIYPETDTFNVRLGNAAKCSENSARIALLKGGNEFSERSVTELSQKFKVKLSEDDNTYMQKQILQFDLQLAQAEQDARLKADWAKLDQLRGSLERQLSQIKERYFLREVAAEYLASYDTDLSKKDIRLNSALRRFKWVEHIVC
jgi:hypothetical protein